MVDPSGITYRTAITEADAIGLAIGLGLGITFGGVLPWQLSSGGTLATLDIDFVNDRAWNAGASATVGSLLACARATPAAAYYTNADGTLTTFAANTLRYGRAGLLAEEASTNIAVQSQDLTTGWVINSNLTITADATTAPDGTLTADQVSAVAATSDHNIRNGLLSITANPYTTSIFLKMGTWRYVNVVCVDFGSGDRWFACTVDMLAGTITQTGAGAGATYTSSRIFAVAHGFYRVELSGTQANTSSTGSIELQMVASGTPVYSASAWARVVSTAAGTDNFYAWGAQLEVGAFASSYIPTTGGSVTRAADVITFSDVTWFNGTSDTLFVKWTATGRAGTLLAINATDAVTLSETATGAGKILDASVTYAITTGNTDTPGSTAKVAAHMATNDIALCLNAGTVGTDATATQPGTISAARLGVDLSGANPLNGYILEVAAFKNLTASSGALQTLST